MNSKDMVSFLKERFHLVGLKISMDQLKKSDFHDELSSLDFELSNYFKVANINYLARDTVSLMKYSEDEQIEFLKAKLETMKKNPNVSLAESVMFLAHYFQRFLSKYNIGWLEKFETTQFGSIGVTIGCRVSQGFTACDTIGPVAAKIAFENQLATLKDMGLTLFDHYGLSFENTESNRKILENLFVSRGAKLVKMDISNHIEEISFIISPKDCKNFDCEEISTEMPSDENLNENDIAKLNKEIKDLLYSLSCIEALSMAETCGYLVAHHFSKICEIFGFNGEISTGINLKHQEARNKNQYIRELQAKMGQIIPAENIPTAIEDAHDKLDGYLNNNMGFRVSEFTIGEYGNVKAKICFNRTTHHYGKGKLITEENLKKLFETFGDSWENENLFIENTTENAQKIISLLKDAYPSSDILSLSADSRKGKLVIDSIMVSFQNIQEIFDKDYVSNDDF